MFILFWMNAPRTSELYCRCFGNPYCLNLQGVVPQSSCTTYSACPPLGHQVMANRKKMTF